jgi:MFS family permease
MLYFATRTLHMDLGFYGKAMATQFFVSFLQSYFLGWLADKIHPLRLTIISLILYTTASLCCFYLVHSAWGGFLTSVFVGSAAGWWLTANGPLTMALFPKIDFAQFYAAASVTSSIGMLAIAFLCGWYLDYADHNYRYILLWNAILAMAALMASFVVYSKFLKLGGTTSYVPPLPSSPNADV